MESSSIELVRACAGSIDERAWQEFIRRMQPVIGAAVLRTANLWDEASPVLLDDLIQDTYLKLCDNDRRMLHSFQPKHEDSIYGLLRVVAANVAHDHFKGALAEKRGARQTESMGPVEMDSRMAAPDGFELVSQRLLLQKIDRVLLQVTAGKDQARKCTIFWLRHRQGLTAREIAAIPSIGLSKEGIESMLMRLGVAIRDHFESSLPHREVKVLSRQNRSRKVGS